MANWQHPTVGELIDAGQLLVSDGYRARNEELGCAGTPFVRGGDIGDGVIDTAPKDRVKPQFEHRIASKLSRPGDTAFITKGTVGRAGFLRHDQPTVVFAPQVAYWRSLNTETLDPRFVFYFIRSKMFQNALEAVMTRGAMVADYVSIAEQRRFRVPLPPIVEQRQIGGLLGLLDDKIALNARMNVTLEAMARAVFEDWFVRFGPVRAKAEGRAPPGLAPDLAALFPDRLTETPDGEVPEGWTIGQFGQIAVNRTDMCQPGDLPEETPYFGLEHMPRRSIALDSWGSAGNVGSAKLLFQRGDFLFGKLRPYFHKVGVAPVDGVCTTDAVVVRARRPELATLVLMVLSSTEFVGFTDRGSTGTKMPRTRWQDMARYRCAVPTVAVSQAFTSFASPMIERIVSNIHETRTLTSLRDLLLPRLISGQLRLRDAERAVEAAL